jgi:hypothetical protein
MTDWGLWGMQAEAQMAIASAQARIDRMTGQWALEEDVNADILTRTVVY